MPCYELSIIAQALVNKGTNKEHDSGRFGYLMINYVDHRLVVTAESHRGIGKFTCPDEYCYNGREELQKGEISQVAWDSPWCVCVEGLEPITAVSGGWAQSAQCTQQTLWCSGGPL